MNYSRVTPASNNGYNDAHNKDVRGTSNAGIPDINTLIQAGINPKTGLPYKFDSSDPCTLQTNIKMQLRILDEQDAINRYKWYNLPSGLDGQLIERILYYKGQAAFFYMESNQTFYFLPYALDGNIDVYGRFLGITPLPWKGGTTSEGKEKPWIQGLVKKPIYKFEDALRSNNIDEVCVLLNDYSKQQAETVISRQIVQDPLLEVMSEVFPMARTSLIANSGIRGMRVNDEDQAEEVKKASKSVARAAKTGNPWVPIVGNMEFQDLTNGTPLKSEEYLIMMQALDNYRLSLYGLKNGGLFQKKSHMLESEQQMNDGNVGLVYQDGLTIRQKFCDMVNAIYGLSIWCEASETVIGVDRDMNGMVGDELDQSGMPGEQPQQMEVESDDELKY